MFEWLLSQNIIDLDAPFAAGKPDEGAGSLEEEEGEKGRGCPICLDPMTTPALCCVLQCGHTLCRHCTRELIQHLPSPEDARVEGRGSFCCPMCRRMVSAVA